jgi:hypothetical protein
MRGRVAFGVWALSLMVLASRSLANDPFITSETHFL